MDKIGSKNVNSGFASMRVTAVMSVRGDGSRVKPLILFKGVCKDIVRE